MSSLFTSEGQKKVGSAEAYVTDTFAKLTQASFMTSPIHSSTFNRRF